MAGQSMPPNKKVVKNLISELFSFIISSSIVCVWILTGHWLLMDVLGMGIYSMDLYSLEFTFERYF